MKKTLFVIVAGVAAVTVAALPSAAADKGMKRVMISERMQVTLNPATGCGTQSGRWMGAGAINDEGSASATFCVRPRKNGRGILTGDHTLVGTGGQIVVRTRGTVTPFPPPVRAMVIGHWSIVNATGSYAGLEGRGRIWAVGNFVSGEATIMRLGHAAKDD